MKLKMKRALLVLLAGAVLLTALAGCGGDTGSTADGSESTGGASEGSAASGETGVEEYHINVLVASSSVNSSEETYIGQLVKEKFNVVFDYEIYAGDMVEKTNLQLAGGDYGDIVNVQWDNNVVNWIDAGAVIALDDLMAEYSQRSQSLLLQHGPECCGKKRQAQAFHFDWNLECGDGCGFKALGI